MRKGVYIGEVNDFGVTPNPLGLPYFLFCPTCVLKFPWNKYYKINKIGDDSSVHLGLCLFFVLSSSGQLQWITFSSIFP